MAKDIKITKVDSNESATGAILDSALRLATLGFVGLPDSGEQVKLHVDGEYIGKYSSADEAFKAASKR